MAELSQVSYNNTTYNLRDDVSVWGGRNLFSGTNNFSNWYFNTSNFSSPEYKVLQCTSPSQGWYYAGSPCIPAADVAGKTITISFDYRRVGAASTAGYVTPAICLQTKTSGAAATNYTTRVHEWSTSGSTATENWQHHTVTTTLNYSSWSQPGSGSDTWLCICMWNYSTTTFQIRNLKVEIGNKPTAWSPAPEDIVRINGSTLELFG